MAEIRWSPQAADDLESITAFISTDSAYYAQLLAIDVLAAVERLETFPLSGRVVPEISDVEIREIILGNYRIVYRYQNILVDILTIYHGARLLNPLDLDVE